MKKVFPLRFGIALGLLSASVIACQLALMQILAIVQWHHFAYMIISIAMLGFGAAGTAISLFREKLIKHKDTLIPLLAVAAGLSIEFALRLTSTEFLAFDLYHLFIDKNQFWKLAAGFIIYFLPFFFAALAIGITFTAWVSDIGRLYFANLVGSGLGGLFALLILNMLYPCDSISLFAVLAMISGLLMIRNFKMVLKIALTVIVVCGSLLTWLWPYEIRPSQYKSLSKALNLPEAKIIYQEPGIYGLNQVLTSPAMRYAPGIGLSFRGEIPARPAVFTNGDFAGVLTNNWEHIPHPSNYSTFALPFAMGACDTVLVLNSGTGYYVAHALSRGALLVDVTESNKKLVNLMQTVLADASGSLYNLENVQVHTIEARTFLASTKQQYDIIILPVMDAFGGTSGLYAMQENYTLTIEAFNQMWQKLKPNGFITVSAWLDYPVRTSLKITATLMEMLKQQKVPDPSQHLLMIKSWGTVTFVVCKSPVGENQINAARIFCDSLFFDPVLLPGITVEERNRYNAFSDSSFFCMLDNFVSGSPNYNDYAFYIKPSTDNRPYFNQFIRLKTIPMLSGLYNMQALPFIELGYLIVFVTLIMVSLLALLLIITPLFALKTCTGNKLPTLLYFASLGLGYMFVEIILIQRFVIYFGNPVVAASVVISIMLMASGAGSFISSGLSLNRKTIMAVLALVVVCGLILLAGLNILLKTSIGSGIYLKLFIAFVTISFPAFFMGMPFPLGLKTVSWHRNSLVPWAWGINGCISVAASPLAVIIAVEAGFTSVMGIAVLAYLLALFAARKLFSVAPIP